MWTDEKIADEVRRASWYDAGLGLRVIHDDGMERLLKQQRADTEASLREMERRLEQLRELVVEEIVDLQIWGIAAFTKGEGGYSV